MDSPYLAILIGGGLAAAGWALPFFTLRGNSGAQSVLLLDVVRKAEGDQYNIRILNLEADNKLIRAQLLRCQEDRNEEREKYIDLLERRVSPEAPPRRRRSAKTEE